jgi:hypothetical protein
MYSMRLEKSYQKITGQFLMRLSCRKKLPGKLSIRNFSGPHRKRVPGREILTRQENSTIHIR